MTDPAPILLIKVGGSTLNADDTSLADIVALRREGSRPVVVHGGGETVTKWMAKQGVRTQFVDGLRVTDAEVLAVATAVLAGLVNKQLVASLLALGGPAVGISGADGALLKASIDRPELGYVGSAMQVDTGPILALLEAEYIPVVAPIAVERPPIAAQQPGVSEQGYHLLNVNADTVAGALAVALGASRLVFLTDVAGVLDGSGRLLQRILHEQAQGLLASGIVKGGMIPKLEACVYATEHGTSAHIIDGRRPGALLERLQGAVMGTTVA